MDTGFDLEQLLEEGNQIRVKPQGYSMYPLLVPGRDEVVIEQEDPSRLHRGDIVLFRREGSILVLHRICRRRGDNFFMVGDNQKANGDFFSLWRRYRRQKKQAEYYGGA